MIIQVDSREQKNKEVLDYFNSVGQQFVVSKMYTADYCNLQKPTIVIDLKKDLLEVCGNLTRDHARFRAEVLRAKDILKAKFVVLIREPFQSLESVKTWKSKRTKTNGEKIYKIMKTFATKYGVVWEFCTRETAGQKIIEILGEKNAKMLLTNKQISNTIKEP